MSQYLLLALLALGAILPADGCSCVSKHLQRSFCGSSAAVLKVKFRSVNFTEVYGEYNYTLITYGIDRLQVFKGGAEIQNLMYIYSSTEYGCGFTINPSDIEYLVAGPSHSGRVYLINCDYVVAWRELTACQINGIQGAYKKGCGCNILSCEFGQCDGMATTDDCKFNEPYPDGAPSPAPGSSNATPENMVCARGETGTCGWQPIGEC